MFDSLILLKLAALGCIGTIFIAIASFLRWIEEESYKNEDGLETSTGMINSSEHKRSPPLPMNLSPAPPPAFRFTGKECEWLTDSVGSTAAEDTTLKEEACEGKTSAFHGTCTISNEPDSKTNLRVVTTKRVHVLHASVNQSPPVDELVDLAQQCLHLHGCKGNIQYRTGIRGDLIIDISLTVPTNVPTNSPTNRNKKI